MDEVTNRVELCGTVLDDPGFSHESRGIRFYSFPLQTRRLSGAADRINIIAREGLLAGPCPELGDRLQLLGELRSFNNKSGTGARLVITVFARQLLPWSGPDENCAELAGTLCKEPVLRRTPLGREICDMILAVPRRYRRSDYIPVITWGAQARDAALCGVGTRLLLRGRIQSRQYTKVLDGVSMERTAFELSANDLMILQASY